MNTNGKFYRQALTLFAFLSLCIVVSCIEPEQPEKPLVIVNNNYVKCPDTKPSQVREELEKKYALVIGNNKYVPDAGRLSKLKNAANDAESMECALKILGWEVKIITDATVDEMKTGLEWLKKQLSGNKKSYGFFFFAGHAVENDSLLPVDDKPTA